MPSIKPKQLKTTSAVAVLMSGLVLWSCQSSEPSFRGTDLGETMPTTDFTLTDQYGQPFTLSHERGKVILMFFGFTYCPDVCPLTLSTWKKVEEALQNDADRVEFVYITVDPERDTQEKLRKHLAIFSKDFIGLTGTQAELVKVYDSYGVYREKVSVSESAAGYLVNHTASLFVIDQEGRWRLSISHDAPVEDIVHDVRLLLKNKASERS